MALILQTCGLESPGILTNMLIKKYSDTLLDWMEAKIAETEAKIEKVQKEIDEINKDMSKEGKRNEDDNE